nr:hypothetical protein [Tanacetum cinerariifolium]
MASFNYRLNPLYLIKECSYCGSLYTTDYCCSGGSLGDKIICDLDKTPDLSQQPPQNCPKYGNPVDGHYCQGCALLHYCCSGGSLGDKIICDLDKTPDLSQQPPQNCPKYGNPVDGHYCQVCALLHGNSFTYDSKSNIVYDSPNVFDPPLQPPLYSYEFCGNDARYSHYCTPQVPFIYPESCYN